MSGLDLKFRLTILLEKLQKDFVLLHIHGNNNAPSIFANNVIGALPSVIELSYINKALVKSYDISDNQKFPKSFDMPNTTDSLELNFELLDAE